MSRQHTVFDALKQGERDVFLENSESGLDSTDGSPRVCELQRSSLPQNFCLRHVCPVAFEWWKVRKEVGLDDQVLDVKSPLSHDSLVSGD